MNRHTDFPSKALEMNLGETRGKKISIPDDQLWFISLSRDYTGINSRTKKFFIELNHPYPDYPWIIQNLKRICLGDFWLYHEHTEAERAYDVLIRCTELLLSRKVPYEFQRDLFHTLFQLLEKLLSEDTVLESSAFSILSFIENHLHLEQLPVLYTAGHLSDLSYPKDHDTELTRKLHFITRKILSLNFRYWKENTQVEEYIKNNTRLFAAGCLPHIKKKAGPDYFSGLEEKLAATECWEELADLPMFREIAEHLRSAADIFQTPLERIYYLYSLLQLSGMNHLKDHLLWDINRLLKQALKSLDEEGKKSFIDSIFEVFQNFKADHMSTILDCIETLGREIVLSGETSLVRQFTDKLIAFGFVYPGEVRIKTDWQVEVNPDHLKNIRVWLAIIECSPTATKRLLASLVVHLRVGGVFIQDTDLFQKDMSRLLNNEIEGIYKLIKHLAVMFPIYYNEIGAEGELREVTTKLDEISGRRDIIIHFLRKQIHAESNNTHIELTKSILQYWYSGNSEPLIPLLPRDVSAAIDTDSPWFTGVHTVLRAVCDRTGMSPSELLLVDKGKIYTCFSGITSGTEKDRDRVRYLLRLAWLLHEKYSIDTRNILHTLKKTSLVSLSDLARLESFLDKEPKDEALLTIFEIMKNLKDIILDPVPSEGWENIYYKRHIAAGIPSMYGQYHEKKYEALGHTLRLEHTANILMGEIIRGTSFSYTSLKNLKRTAEILEYFRRGLEIRGIFNQSFESNIHMLQYSLSSGSFSIHQYVNIFQFFIRNIREIIDQYFISVYDKPLKQVLKVKYEGTTSGTEMVKLITRESESFYRDILASSFFIQTLDQFLSQILRSLRETRDTIPRNLIHKAMSYDPDLLANPIYKPMIQTDNKIFLGAKAYFLKKLVSLGYPIPEGFVLTTELFRHKDIILMHPQMEYEVEELIRDEISRLEDKTGRLYGDPVNPLFLSVRSGSAFSMPGAMNTFLNVGMNRQIAEALSRNPRFSWAAWDCFRRLLQSWGMSYGIRRDEFDFIMKEMKLQHGVEKKRQFSPEQMEQLADRYYRLLETHGIAFESDPFLQLKHSILAVIESWSSKRAQVYRNHLQIADEWGTAVLIQRMIFGNLDTMSGTGVVFTKNPDGDNRIRLYGDYIPCSQGEDVVSGLVHTLPVSSRAGQAGTESAGYTLQERFPVIYRKLVEYSSKLLNENDFPHQEIEFTFESPEDLYILQTRDQVFRERKSIEIFETDDELIQPAGRGIGVGGGAMNGIAAFDLADIQSFREKFPNQNCILIRPDTVPDDIEMVFACDGLLTARGGVTSHAAVTAVQLGTVCVVNCRDLMVDEEHKAAVLNGIRFVSGDKIAIDGMNGSIFKGNLPIGTRNREMQP